MSGDEASEEFERALAEQQLAERVRALALLAFSPDELAAIPAEQGLVLKVLIKRRLSQGEPEPGIADILSIRRQFEDYCQNRLGDPAAMRLAAQLR